MDMKDIKKINDVPVKFIGILQDDGLNECMRCGHESDTHAEFEYENDDTEAEVVCPKCGSPAYFVKD